MPNGYPLHQKAKILIECDFATDKEISGRWNITTRTIENYRAQLKTDPALLIEYNRLKDIFSREWVNDASRGIKTFISALETVVKRKNPKDAQWITATATAIKCVGELSIAYTALADEPTVDQQSKETSEA